MESVSMQIRDISRDLKSFGVKTTKSCDGALKHSADWVRNRLKEIYRDRFKVTPYISVKFSQTRDGQIARIYVMMDAVWLKIFKDAYQTPLGVKVNDRLYRHAFIAYLGHQTLPGVYRRLTKNRFPIKRVYIQVGSDLEEQFFVMLYDDLFKEFYQRFGQAWGEDIPLVVDLRAKKIRRGALWRGTKDSGKNPVRFMR